VTNATGAMKLKMSPTVHAAEIRAGTNLRVGVRMKPLLGVGRYPLKQTKRDAEL